MEEGDRVRVPRGELVEDRVMDTVGVGVVKGSARVGERPEEGEPPGPPITPPPVGDAEPNPRDALTLLLPLFEVEGEGVDVGYHTVKVTVMVPEALEEVVRVPREEALGQALVEGVWEALLEVPGDGEPGQGVEVVVADRVGPPPPPSAPGVGVTVPDPLALAVPPPAVPVESRSVVGVAL